LLRNYVQFQAVFLIINQFVYPSDINDLKQKIEALAKDFKGKIGVSLHHLKTTERLEILGDEKFPTGSTIKVALLCVIMEKVEKGELNYYQKFVVTEDDISGGTGFMRRYKVGSQVTLKEILHFMITASDNTATDMVMRIIGSDATVNDWLKTNNLPNTRLNIPLPFNKADWEDQARHKIVFAEFDKWGMGGSTTNEMRTLMEMIAEGKAGTEAACDEMHRILNHQYFDDGIAGQTPPSVIVASKSGIEKQSRSDIAIVHAPSGTYTLAIYTKEAEDFRISRDNAQDSAIRAIARLVWQHYEPDSKYSPPKGTEKFSTGPDW
jgi:beta-lactamase class A